MLVITKTLAMENGRKRCAKYATEENLTPSWPSNVQFLKIAE